MNEIPNIPNTFRAAEKAALELEAAQIKAELMRDELGVALEARRRERQLSARCVARQLGISVVYLRDIELGRRNPMADVDRLRHWLSILD